MDELELLKKDWQKKDKDFPKLTYNEIYKMILKKSSSIVKWIFIISILEFVFWVGIAFLLKYTGYADDMANVGSNTAFIIMSVISYIILAYFFYRFYMNYRTINTTDNATTLMENILRTRRTVKQYVGFNLIAMVVSVGILLPYFIKQDPESQTIIEQATADGELLKFYAGIIIVTLLMLAVVIGILLLFYWLIYGILLKRLNKNYRELKKLEV
ncbi:DUF898 domain-containing protein [Pontimicrobium aquaticum]|uniref:DUF898 domain-containing protein n=1 Tax=Pontimicrobium aquaticum TaxID=2565367 RepID=A0A4U0EWD0_9FLAO|nr:DUF898 domain-containing protein [Pontimicrobium aquaticum]TJY36223.1 DUF898 domain-containing protein [Pontimicrobium aquaticum]